MKRKWISLLSFLASVCLLLGLSACDVFGGENKEIRQIQYELSEDGTYYIVASSGTGELEKKTLVIPETYNNLPVKAIEEKAFEDCFELTSVTIPSTIVAIGEDAFYACGKLTEINFNAIDLQNTKWISAPDSVVIEVWDGEENESSMDETVEQKDCDIFSYAGCDGKGITLNIGAGVTQIPAYLFGEPVGAQGDFGSAPKITKVVFENNSTFKTMGESAFEDCREIKGVYITDIDAWCETEFANASANPLAYADGASLYVNNQQVKDLEISLGVKEIKPFAFIECTGLTSVSIPSSVKSVGERAFDYCEELTSVILSHGVEVIEVGAFSACHSLASVSIPASVTTIDRDSFVFCPIQTATIPTIAMQAIANANLRTVVLIGGETIEWSVFANCEALTSITIPESVTTIKMGAFSGCTALTEIYFNATAMNDLFWENGAFSNAGSKGDGITVYIGANVTKIPAFLFSSSPKITEVVFAEDSVCKSIGSESFIGCESLSKISFPARITTIAKRAFYNCDGLTEVTIPASVTMIEEDAFRYCDNLTSMRFENAEGWYYAWTSTSSSGTDMPLEEPTQNARYFTDTYAAFFWKRRG